MKDEKIRYNMLLEFNSFLYNLAHYEDVFNKKREDLYKPPLYVKELIDSTYNDLSPLMKSDLRVLYKDTILVSNAISSADNYEKFNNYQDFRKYLKSISAKDYLQDIFDLFEIKTENKTDEDAINEIENILIKMDQNQTIIESYKELKKYPQQTMNRIIDFLDLFYFEYFKKAEESIKEFLISKLLKHQKLYEQNRSKFINELVIVSFDEKETNNIDYIFYLGYLNIWGLSYTLTENNLICCYSYLYERHFDPKYFDQQLVGLFKSLSDETRLNIIRKLSEKSYYSKELADEIEMNKATISYHMKKFRDFKIINLRLGESKRIYYSLDKKNLENVFSRFMETLK